MKTITVRADREFDALVTHLARRMKTTRSGLIRDAVRSYQSHLEREALRRRLRAASLKTRAQAVQAGEDFDAANADGL
jgi:predicted transcriptional regulator